MTNKLTLRGTRGPVDVWHRANAADIGQIGDMLELADRALAKPLPAHMVRLISRNRDILQRVHARKYAEQFTCAAR